MVTKKEYVGYSSVGAPYGNSNERIGTRSAVGTAVLL